MIACCSRTSPFALAALAALFSIEGCAMEAGDAQDYEDSAELALYSEDQPAGELGDEAGDEENVTSASHALNGFGGYNPFGGYGRWTGYGGWGNLAAGYGGWGGLAGALGAAGLGGAYGWGGVGPGVGGFGGPGGGVGRWGYGGYPGPVGGGFGAPWGYGGYPFGLNPGGGYFAGCPHGLCY